MAGKRKVKSGDTLREACWRRGITVVALCSELSISRQTAYEAWASPKLFPIAAPKLFKALGIINGHQNQSN